MNIGHSVVNVPCMNRHEYSQPLISTTLFAYKMVSE